MKNLLFLLTLFSVISYSQEKYKVGIEDREGYDKYSIINSKGDTIRKLEHKKYLICFTLEFENFAVFGIRGEKNWCAIDINENILFNVYNTSFGEPSPDYLRENRIRIVNGENKIGFANGKGEIIVKPNFEMVSSYSNGKAIIGKKCKKIPWGNHEHSDCKHYSIECKNYGYIDKKGEILKIGNYTFESIKKEINWQPPEY